MMSAAISHPLPIEIGDFENSLSDVIPIVKFSNRKPQKKLTTKTELRERELVSALRRKDETAFSSLVDQYHNRFIRVARAYVSSEAMAEEVAQETWLGVLDGIHRFEGRSSVRTWMFKILMNQAKTKGQRESRYVPFLSMKNAMDDKAETHSEPERFLGTGQEGGTWASPQRRWEERTPERLLENKEALRLVEQAIESLSPNQRQALTLRDIEGLESAEVDELMNITTTNQRVLLHRARTIVRKRINQYPEESREGDGLTQRPCSKFNET